MVDTNPTYQNTVQDLSDSQKSEHDMREIARESDHFVNKQDGQWEPDIVKKFKGKPRYTFDLTSGIINDVFGEISGMDFTIKVIPAGGPATTQNALHYAGLIRNIENNSGNGAKYIYRAAAKQMLTTGIGGWGIKQGFRDSTSMDQDLIIYPISGFMDRVWFGAGYELPDASDSESGFKLTSMSKYQYDMDFPDGSGASIGRDLNNNTYYYKDDNAVIVGEHFWKKRTKTDLHRMSDGSIYLQNEKFESVKDDLKAKGITIEKTRSTESVKVYHQMFDGIDYINDPTETVFTYIPLVPVYGNFEISEDKVIYWGLVEKHKDPQRVLNYIESRKVEEGALSPRRKIVLTPEQAKGHTDTLSTLNTNTDPVQFLNHIANQPQPYELGGAQINPGLSEASQSMNRYMQSISGRLDPSGDPSLGLQSGVALKAMQNKGDTANMPYITSVEVAIAHTCRILGEAIPLTYDALREIQIDEQDGTTNTVTINERVFDQDSGKIVELNDLSKGSYSFICSAGPAFDNKQEEMVRSLNELAAIDPSIMQLGADIYLSNIPVPGMDKIQNRKRIQMIAQGLIPFEELTDEEKQKEQKKQEAQAQQSQQPSAVDQALIATATAEADNAKSKTADTMSKIEERAKKFELEIEKLKLASKKVDNEQQINSNKLVIESMKATNEEVKMMADTLQVIKEAMGVETIIGPNVTKAYNRQADQLLSAIETSE